MWVSRTVNSGAVIGLWDEANPRTVCRIGDRPSIEQDFTKRRALEPAGR